MRSQPPASSHFAESPVPAPPPTIGSPRAAIARNFSNKVERSKRGMFTSPRVCGRSRAVQRAKRRPCLFARRQPKLQHVPRAAIVSRRRADVGGEKARGPGKTEIEALFATLQRL